MSYKTSPPAFALVGVRADGREQTIDVGSKAHCQRSAGWLQQWPGWVRVEVRELNPVLEPTRGNR